MKKTGRKKSRFHLAHSELFRNFATYKQKMTMETRKINTARGNSIICTLEMLRKSRITMPDRPRTTLVSPDETENTIRKVVEYTDYPIKTVSGRQLIRRVEKILMPNGRYRYPETYIDMTPGFTIAPKDWDKDRVKGYEMDIKL